MAQKRLALKGVKKQADTKKRTAKTVSIPRTGKQSSKGDCKCGGHG